MELTLEILTGKTFTKVERSPRRERKEDSLNFDIGDEIVFTVSESEKYRLYHDQDCCEQVGIEDICGELSDLVGVQLLQAEESSNREETEDGSSTWTFYRFATIKGSVTIRWVGSSNGYYSEAVSFAKI